MTARAYRKPRWWLRAIGNRLAPLVNPRLVATLSVRGRRSGQWRTVPVVVFIRAYLRRYGKMPGVKTSFDQLADPADHPAFRIVTHP
jgi:hypothetical protein